MLLTRSAPATPESRLFQQPFLAQQFNRILDGDRVADPARLGEHIFFSLLNKHLVNYGNHRTCFRMINRTAAVTRIGRGIELKEVIDLPSV